METWVKAIDFPEYEVSDAGRVRRVSSARGATSGAVLKAYDSNGYLKVTLTAGNRKRKVSVHRLVLESFVGRPNEKMDCCHFNGVRTDNRLENLRWASRAENMSDAKRHGTAAIGEKNGHAILKREDVVTIRQLRSAGAKVGEIAKLFSVTHQAISDICRYRNWRHV